MSPSDFERYQSLGVVLRPATRADLPRFGYPVDGSVDDLWFVKSLLRYGRTISLIPNGDLMRGLAERTAMHLVPFAHAAQLALAEISVDGRLPDDLAAWANDPMGFDVLPPRLIEAMRVASSTDASSAAASSLADRATHVRESLEACPWIRPALDDDLEPFHQVVAARLRTAPSHVS